MKSSTSHSCLRPFGWCVVLLLICMQSWGQETGCISGNCVNGQGTFTSADGRKYVGEWRDGKQHGLGTETSADGSVVTGMWDDGAFLRTAEQNRIFNACILDKSNDVELIFAFTTF